jgi:HK97 family phage prohead protease
MFKRFRRSRALRQLAEFTPKQAAHILRFAIASDVPVDSRIMLALTLRAIEGATGPGRTVLERFADAYRAGRRVKFMTGHVLMDGETPELVAEVEKRAPGSQQGDNDMNRNHETVSREDAEKTVHLIRMMTRADVKTIDGLGTFVGYAATFDPLTEPDRSGDVIHPNAFDGTLARWRNRKAWPPLVWGHEWNLAGTVGAITSMYTDGRGLVVHGRLDLEHPPAAELYAAMKAGRVNSMSFAFDVLDKKDHVPVGNGESVNLLLELELLEVSIVLVPANPNARVLAIKADTRLEKEAAWAAHERPTSTSTSSATASPDGDSYEPDELALINARLDQLASNERPRSSELARQVDDLITEVRLELAQEALDRAEQAAWERRMHLNLVLAPAPVRVDARMRPVTG